MTFSSPREIASELDRFVAKASDCAAVGTGKPTMKTKRRLRQ